MLKKAAKGPAELQWRLEQKSQAAAENQKKKEVPKTGNEAEEK